MLVVVCLAAFAAFRLEERQEQIRNSGETFILSISRDPEERKTTDDGNSEEDTAITAYARAGQSQIVYKISSSDYLALKAADYDELRHHEVFWADFDDITQIDVVLEGSTHTLTVEDKDGEHIWSYQDEEIEITSFRNTLEKLSADSFTDERAAGKEEISLKLYLNNENFEQTEIILYRYDGESCLAVVDGQPVSLVSRASAVNLIEAVNAIILN